jgi:DNA-binding SARP family transcriptional activator
MRLQLLGNLAIVAPSLASGAPSRRRRSLALLALVASAAPRPIGREKLLAYLWPESDPDHGGNSLRQTLFGLRRDLGEDVFLKESGKDIQLDPARITVDLWEFNDAVARQDAGRVVELYGGPFLDGFQNAELPEFSRWVDSERERLERRYLGALDAFAQRADEAGRYDESVSWRRRQAASDPYSSRAALGLLRALAAAGDRPGALQYSRVYENLIRLDLDVDPDPAVMDFVASLRRDSAAVGLTVHGSDGFRPAVERSPARMEMPEAPADALSDVDENRPESLAERSSPLPEASGIRSRARPWFTIRSRRGLATAVVAVIVMAVAGLGWSRWPGFRVDGLSAAPGADLQTMVLLGSGKTDDSGRDQANRLVACDGPACPEDALPQRAFIVPKHPAHMAPVAGMHYIAPVREGAEHSPPGFACCTTATFENEFSLPPDAVSARIAIWVLADNQAAVEVNGVEFGRHADPLGSDNFAGPPAAFSKVFAPDPSGVNRLRVILHDGGGALALHYNAIVTYEVIVDGDGDGVPDDEDAYPGSDLRPTAFVGRCDSGVGNQVLANPRGATFNDLIGEAPTGGGIDELVPFVNSLTAGWIAAGLITERDPGWIAACATGSRARL